MWEHFCGEHPHEEHFLEEHHHESTTSGSVTLGSAILGSTAAGALPGEHGRLSGVLRGLCLSQQDTEGKAVGRSPVPLCSEAPG